MVGRLGGMTLKSIKHIDYTCYRGAVQNFISIFYICSILIKSTKLL